MATVNKNFRIKNGLIVEGSTATVNGSNVLTEASTEFLQDLAATMLTDGSHTNVSVSYNDADGTIGLTAAATYTNEMAQDAIGNNLGTGLSYDDSTGAISVTANTYDSYGSASSAQTAAQNYADGLASNYDPAGAASSAQTAAQNYADGLASNYDPAGAASTAESNAATYTTNAINALDTDDIEEGASNLYYTDTRARGAVSAGSGLSYNSGTGEFSVDTTTIANKTYVDNAITDLVDGAPGLLDTLNEIAAAINDDENFFTTISNNLAAKLSLSGGTMTGDLTLSGAPTQNLHAATKAYVDSAQSTAQSNAETTAQNALSDVLDGTTEFTAVDINSVSRQIATTTGNIVTAAATTAVSWSKTAYRSAKILVKAKNGSHTQVSEVIVSLDTSDNIALNEYAITTTNGSLMTIDADIDSGNVRVRVTPTNNNTEVMAHATLLV